MKKENEKKFIKIGFVLGTISLMLFFAQTIIYFSGMFILPTSLICMLVFVPITEVLGIFAVFNTLLFLKNNKTKEYKKQIVLTLAFSVFTLVANTLIFVPIILTGKIF